MTEKEMLEEQRIELELDIADIEDELDTLVLNGEEEGEDYKCLSQDLDYLDKQLYEVEVSLEKLKEQD